MTALHYFNYEEMGEMAQKNKKKQEIQDVHTLINQLEKMPATTNVADKIEQDEVNHRDSGVHDNQ
ncbi:hypothetical protein [Aneurinibacillus sp. REN35]|uniref:hypothetical protein n=1 Tax=Aneurinibacillus sp. REN35 TaxID=3237286 RepID=UPI003528E085